MLLMKSKNLFNKNAYQNQTNLHQTNYKKYYHQIRVTKQKKKNKIQLLKKE